jgi:hypothetical protein
MKAVVIVESMFGNTLSIADAIRSGMQTHCSVSVISVTRVESTDLLDTDVVVVGGPTHIHGISTEVSRQNAAILALDSSSELKLDSNAAGSGIREWLQLVHKEELPNLYATFDTRVRGLQVITGATSRQINAQLRRLGKDQVLPPMSFLVGSDHKLIAGKREHAKEWGDHLAQSVLARFHSAARGMP